MKKLTPAKVTIMMFLMVGGLVAAFVAKRLFAVEETKPEAKRRDMPMAISALEPGTVITADHIGLGPVKISDLKPDMLMSNRVIVGRVVKEHIQAATPIQSGQLYQPGELPPLELGEGMRAVTLGLGQTVSIVDGLIKPGQFVDIHMTVTRNVSDARLQGGLTLTLAKGVKILAINRNFSQGTIDRRSNNVTVELTPEQANIIILAQEKGLLTLTYNPEGRGTGGVAVSSADRATLDEILGLKPLPEPAKPIVTEIYRKTSRQVNHFIDGRKTNRRNGLRSSSISNRGPGQNNSGSSSNPSQNSSDAPQEPSA